MAEIGKMDFAFELSEFTKGLIDKDVLFLRETLEVANKRLERWGVMAKVEIVEIEK